MKHRKRLGNKGGIFEWIVVLVVMFGCAVIWMGTYGLIHVFMPNVLSTLNINSEQYGLQYISVVYDMLFPAIILLTIIWAFTSPERIEGGMNQL